MAEALEVVQQYKFHVTVIYDKFTFEAHVDPERAKDHQRMYFHGKLKNYNVDTFFQ